ncbi:MAG: DUF4430 domain-containing protein [Clostridiales Family XIII bacterium]|jgi:hypothetical protein|nr:DUF4430 domain-containing protein [Clostridiales Family XIII bacterium]
MKLTKKTAILIACIAVTVAAIGIWRLSPGDDASAGKSGALEIATPIAAEVDESVTGAASSTVAAADEDAIASPPAATSPAAASGAEKGDDTSRTKDAEKDAEKATKGGKTKNSEKKPPKSNEKNPQKPAESPSEKPEEKPTPDSPEKKLTVTLSIDCKTILNNTDKLDPAKTGIVPSDGVIMAAKEVEFTAGETVFDVLARECRAAKIHMEYENVPMYNSAYIEGIANLYEFDCGELSGWMYSVNSVYPNYGCSVYTLKDGDVVKWRYTCDLGVDIGGDEATAG